MAAVWSTAAALAASTPARAELSVFAAASLQDVLEEVAGPDVRISVAGSATLARQIEGGAPADVFVSANVDWMTRLDRLGFLAPGGPRDVASNRLALIASGGGASDRADLPADFDISGALGDGRLATALTGSVPLGLYAREALERRGAWDAVRPRLAEADNARAALVLVDRGEAPLGVVYATDVAAGDAVRIVGLFPAADHAPIRYQAAALAGARDPAGAQAFVDRLAGADGRRAFVRWGFEPPRAGPPRPPDAMDVADAKTVWLGLGPAEWEAVALSLQVSLVATLVTVPIAVGFAFALARGRFWGRELLNGLVYLPLVLPPVVTGYLLLLAFGRTGPIGGALEAWFGVGVAFRWTGAAVAGAVMALPLMVRAIRLAIEAVDVRLEEAAATLGAGRWAVFATITAPLIAPGVLAGAALGFAKCMGEFGATITFVSNIPGETRTIASAIYAFTQTPGAEAAAGRLVLVSIALSFGALLVSEHLARRSLRRVRGG